MAFREAFWFWLRLGFINFGGPAGQIAIGKRTLHHPVLVGIAMVSFVAIALVRVPFPAVVPSARRTSRPSGAIDGSPAR